MVKKIELSRDNYRADSVPPDTPCPASVRFRWPSTTRVHVSDQVRVGGSEQRLGALPGGDDFGGWVQQSSPQPAAVGALPYQPTYGL